MEKPNDINYIGKIDAEWVDPKVELPEKSDYYKCKNCVGTEFVTWYSKGARRWDGDVVAWLRIGGPSDAIPRAKVQAAVDEAVGDPALRCGCGMGDCLDCSTDCGIDYAIDIIRNNTGITPTGKE